VKPPIAQKQKQKRKRKRNAMKAKAKRNAMKTKAKAKKCTSTDIVNAVWHLWHLSEGMPMKKHRLTHEQLRALVPAEGATSFADVSDLLMPFGYELHRTEGEFTERRGGPALAVLQELERLLVVEVVVEDNDGTRYDQTTHCVAYTGESIAYTGESIAYTGESIAYTGESIRDNMSHNKVRVIEPSDRSSKESARAVFNSLYKGYSKVMVKAVYELRALAAAAKPVLSIDAAKPVVSIDAAKPVVSIDAAKPVVSIDAAKPVVSIDSAERMEELLNAIQEAHDALNAIAPA
jgi:hypothetical protein